MDLSNRENLRDLREEINGALKAIGERNGVIFDLGSIRFESGGMGFQACLSARSSGADGADVAEAERALYERDCEAAGMPREAYGFEFTSGNTRYALFGVNLKASKNVLRIRRIRDGVEFRAPLAMVKPHWELARAGRAAA